MIPSDNESTIPLNNIKLIKKIVNVSTNKSKTFIVFQKLQLLIFWKIAFVKKILYKM